MSRVESSRLYRERVYEAFADQNQSFEEAVQIALIAGVENFGVDVGFVTSISDDTQFIEFAVPDHEQIRPGVECPLSEAYCRRTVDRESVLSVQHAGESPEIADAAYDRFGVDTYIGSRILVEGEVYGTVCFAATDPRDAPFTDADELFVELVARLIGFGYERSENRRRREERTAHLAAEKRRLERIAETSFDVLFRLSDDGRFVYVSQAIERVLGYAPSQLVGEAFAAHLSEASMDDAIEAFEHVLDGGTVTELQLTFRDADGEDVIVEINATPVEDDGAAIQGVGRDVTARREREAELRMKTRAMDEAAVPITIADARTESTPFVYANDAFEQVTGHASDAILGENYRLLLGDGTGPEAVSSLETAIESAQPVTVELLNYRASGTPFWSRLTLTPIEDEAGVTTHFIGFHQDVTERTRTEQLVELLNRVLRHNLRNELTVIEGCADLIHEGTADSDLDIDLATSLDRPIRRLTALSSQAHELETYAKQARSPGRIDLCAVLQSVADDYRTQYPAATITLDDRTDLDVCAGPEVERAVDELVSNALEHGPADTTVTITARTDCESVEVTVADDGPGIPPLEAAVVEAGRETPLEHGRGLGLWLVNWIVTRYGGSFQIRPEDGTVATLTLPAMGPDDAVDDAVRRPTTLFR